MPSHVLSFGSRVMVKGFPDYMNHLNATNKEFVKEVGRATRRIEREHGACKFEWQSSNAGGVALRRVPRGSEAIIAR